MPLFANAQAGDSYPDYVVIGAFAMHGNAIRFASDANKNSLEAQFQMNPNRNLYYVYVLTTSDHSVAVEYALKLRQETKYFDTWVYSGPMGPLKPGDTPRVSTDVNPVTGETLQVVPSGRESRSLVAEVSRDGDMTRGLPEQTISTDAVVDPPVTEPAARDSSAAEPGPSIPERATEAPLTSEEVVGKDFFFALYRADNHRVVEGKVDAIDIEKSRKMATYEANAPVKVMIPTGKSKQISFISNVFGYRKLQKEFDPANPSPELYLNETGDLVMPFELVRLQKGDMAIMYNVFFFKDAAIMRPESRYEVNNLLDLLLENPQSRIRIHGHTNGNAAGKIIRMDTSDGFFSLSQTKDGIGSAKKLSEERALVIKNYLVSKGISADRMEIKAWGGKKPLFDKNSARAAENVRVEVEILSE
jgi:outer membrane protein OmpA-like peptidoglycan-associated protein